jgi:hypothetical protein
MDGLGCGESAGGTRDTRCDNRAAMCVQCMMTAMGSVAAASGTRTWLGRKKAEWLTPRRLRFITVALFVGAVIAAGTMSGSGGA